MRIWLSITAFCSIIEFNRVVHAQRTTANPKLLRRGLRELVQYLSGRTNTEPEDSQYSTLIVGGQVAPENKYPYYVNWASGSCGGSLIWDDIVLSAAHCAGLRNNQVTIGASSTSSTATATARGESRSIIARRIHPDYNDWTVENDFVILKLNEKSNKTHVDLPSILEDQQLPLDGKDLTVMGFGTMNEGSSVVSTQLREVNVSSISHDSCSSQYGPNSIIDDVMFCAGVPNGGKDSCQGDSGGPIIDVTTGVQVGVVSWGRGCGRASHAGVYARVSAVIDWIRSEVCSLSSDPPDDCNNSSGGNDTENSDGSDVPVSSVDVRINILFDDYPVETGYQISDSNSNIVAGFRAGTFDTPDEFFTETLTLPPGDYELLVEDQHGDGLCCAYGRGNYSVDVLVDGSWEAVVEGDGLFTNFATESFTVPGQERDSTQATTTFTPTTLLPSPTLAPTTVMPTPSPSTLSPSDIESASPSSSSSPSNSGEATVTAAPTESCQDTPNSVVEIDSTVGNKDCEWLATNLERYNFLCQFLDVAFSCPKTCNVCDYFFQ